MIWFFLPHHGRLFFSKQQSIDFLKVWTLKAGVTEKKMVKMAKTNFEFQTRYNVFGLLVLSNAFSHIHIQDSALSKRESSLFDLKKVAYFSHFKIKLNDFNGYDFLLLNQINVMLCKSISKWPERLQNWPLDKSRFWPKRDRNTPLDKIPSALILNDAEHNKTSKMWENFCCDQSQFPEFLQISVINCNTASIRNVIIFLDSQWEFSQLKKQQFGEHHWLLLYTILSSLTQ